MARSSRIYLVMEAVLNEDGDYVSSPKAPFTVKHEMVTWLRNYVIMFPARLNDIYVLVAPDGARPNQYGDTEFEHYGSASDFL